MSRKITSEERRILLENPELVMFDPHPALKTQRISFSKAVLLPTVAGIAFLLCGMLFPGIVHSHPVLFAGFGCAVLVLAVGVAAVRFLKPDDGGIRTAEKNHYVRQLEILLPEEPECRIAHILQVTYEKAEGVWLMNGTEEPFGYSSYVNVSKIEPDSDLAVITDGTAFWAFVRRDSKTESIYDQGSS